MYAVEELLVAEKVSVGGIDIFGWSELATSHKVPEVHVVKKDCSSGRRFCEGVRVGALLRRPLDFDMDSPLYQNTCKNEYALPLSSFGFGEDSCDCCSTLEELPLVRDPADQLLASDSPHDEFFLWLRVALSAEVDSASALSLFDGVFVILMETMSDACSMEEAILNAQEILISEAPKCASEIASIWCATHLDQDLVIHPCSQVCEEQFPEQSVSKQINSTIEKPTLPVKQHNVVQPSNASNEEEVSQSCSSLKRSCQRTDGVQVTNSTNAYAQSFGGLHQACSGPFMQASSQTCTGISFRAEERAGIRVTLLAADVLARLAAVVLSIVFDTFKLIDAQIKLMSMALALSRPLPEPPPSPALERS
jgi:hypothetical protein